MKPSRTSAILPKAIIVAMGTLALAATSSNAATTFLTNNTLLKTLATDEGDAAALEGDGAGDTTALILSADDGAGTINVSTIAAYADVTNISGTPQALGMDADSMGVGNDKWGDPSQGWDFSFNQTVNLTDLAFNENKETHYTLTSTAWKNDSDATGDFWAFTSDGTSGTFILTMQNAPTAFDLSSAGVASVSANTQIRLHRSDGGAGGSGLTSFTISAIPEPSVALLGALGFLALLRRRR